MAFAENLFEFNLEQPDIPFLPPKRRLSRNSWERCWWLKVKTPISSPELLTEFAEQWQIDNLFIKSHQRCCSRLCLVVTTINMDDEESFGYTMKIISAFEQQVAALEKIEDRPADYWPYKHF
ncbi:hypothetical protein [Gynuella sunshinyii]|uniref:Uncharacterized protein n=1 Tax=Gynuella sunshinyii YC6258 TaxID=1445510 RepID=A0A0C5W272_9GAMM|nr:hypothetical protein [Gynuella sunshinyii]AJQ96744.1 hypothetical Protein YC6258_04712 [Gynuella sunshinyii YC6258]